MNTFPLKFRPKVAEEAVAESPTCADSATFALRVLDASMEPEFKQGCLIVIDPSATVTEGAYVLARVDESAVSGKSEDDAEYVFRQASSVDQTRITLNALQDGFEHSGVSIKTQQLVGVIVQRAGLRRSYSKHYR